MKGSVYLKNMFRLLRQCLNTRRAACNRAACEAQWGRSACDRQIRKLRQAKFENPFYNKIHKFRINTIENCIGNCHILNSE
jgi:hypothetical protein